MLREKPQAAVRPGRHPEEETLIKRAQGGDKNAFGALVEHYQGRAYALAFQLLRSEEDARDVTQESFVKAYLSLKNFRGDSSFYTWLYRIVRNMAIDLRRKEGRREVGELDQNEEYPNIEGVVVGTLSRNAETELQNREELSQVEEALQQLSESHRAVLMLREVDGLSYEEISKILGLKRGTVMSRLFYAREQLQTKLGAREENPAVREDRSGSVRSKSEIDQTALKGVVRYEQKQSA